MDKSGSTEAGVDRWMRELVHLGGLWLFWISLDQSGSAKAGVDGVGGMGEMVLLRGPWLY